jgi:phenylacetic acid degradation operon negative regulatory protein
VALQGGLPDRQDDRRRVRGVVEYLPAGGTEGGGGGRASPVPGLRLQRGNAPLETSRLAGQAWRAPAVSYGLVTFGAMSARRSPAASSGQEAPALSRRHAAGAPGARGLLFTVLGEFVLPGDGTAWTSALLLVLARLGIEEKAARQALMRMSGAGWLEAEKIGRRTRWRLSDSARRMLTDGAERIYTFAAPAAEWDGRWLLVSVRIPEIDRRARHMVRTRLSWAGFGSLGPGLWVSPHPEREAEATRALREAGVGDDAHLFVATRHGLAEVQEMVATAWDLAAVEEQYEQFIAEFRARIPGDVLARLIELVHAWRRFPAVDPALPRELLPPRWSGLQAAGLFAERHEQWSVDACREWKRLNNPG